MEWFDRGFVSGYSGATASDFNGLPFYARLNLYNLPKNCRVKCAFPCLMSSIPNCRRKLPPSRKPARINSGVSRAAGARAARGIGRWERVQGSGGRVQGSGRIFPDL